ncbi:glucose-6-phosphate dehydrogenase [Fibrobacterota bacterium]
MTQEHNFVIFGASGDLTARKLMPALYSLYKRKQLPERFGVLGVSRTKWDDVTFREQMEKAIKSFSSDDPDVKPIQSFIKHLYYQSINTLAGEEYSQVKTKLEQVDQEVKTGPNSIFYLSTPPSLYGVIPEYLAQQGLNNADGGWKRLIIEKPFGYNLETARELNRQVLEHFKEDQVYRIDHYLGKETVQNILVFRFANEIMDTIWDYQHIDFVEITSSEHIGVGSRGGYYDQSGATRDMVQNHLLQVLAMITLEPPVTFDADSVRYETLKVFKSLRRLKKSNIPNHAVFGQYTASTIRGEKVNGYRQEPGVPKKSKTDTYAAFKMFIDNSRWFKVPFYLRVGKRLPTRVTEVVIHFKKTPHPAFGVRTGIHGEQNLLVMRIQPDEGIQLKFGMKSPGAGFKVKSQDLNFHYSQDSDLAIPESYERLLLDCMLGDATLYIRGDAVEQCWEFIDPYLEYKESQAKIYGYPAGTWGPKEADALINRDRREWRYPCKNLANDGEYCEL